MPCGNEHVVQRGVMLSSKSHLHCAGATCTDSLQVKLIKGCNWLPCVSQGWGAVP